MGVRKERVKSAFKHIQTGFVPYNVELTGEEAEKVCAYAGIRQDQYFDWAGNHIEKIGYNIGGQESRPGYFCDEYGVTWNRTGQDKDIGVVDSVLLPEADLSYYAFPQPDAAAIAKKTEALLNKNADTFKFGKIGLALYERAWSLRGMENLLMDFLLEESFVFELFESICDYNLKIMDVALQYDIDGFYFGDDYGQQTGLIMSPEVWRRYIKPSLRAMFDKAKSAGKIVALHSCGNIETILGDLIDIGLDAYQTVQPEVYDLDKLKRNFGGSLTFWGGISTQRLLPYASATEVKETVRSLMRRMSAGGGYIAAPTHQVPADVPPENIVALIDLLKNQQ